MIEVGSEFVLLFLSQLLLALRLVPAHLLPTGELQWQLYLARKLSPQFDKASRMPGASKNPSQHFIFLS